MTTESGKSSPSPKPAPARNAKWKRQTAIVSRWLHIYLSMVAFGLVLFFAVTGLTLNHAEWFDGAQKTSDLHGTMPAQYLAGPDQLRIAEYLRATHKIHGTVGDVNVDSDQISIGFKGPGYSADAQIQRKSGSYDLLISSNGFWAVMNDLHKGRDTGKAWAWVIDISAVLLTIVSLTGLILIFFLYKKRTAGLVVAAVGSLLFFAAYRLFVS